MIMIGDTRSGRAADRPSSAPGQREPDHVDADDETLSAEIQEVSAEGPPSHPREGPRRIYMFILLVGAGILLVGIITAIAFDSLAGVVLIVVGAISMITNPEVWAGQMRAKERERVRRRLDEDAKTPSTMEPARRGR